MTAINITENDLSNPERTTDRLVQAYNDNVADTLDMVMSGDMDPVERQTRNLIEDLGGVVVGYEEVVYQQEAANDNEPTKR